MRDEQQKVIEPILNDDDQKPFKEYELHKRVLQLNIFIATQI